MLGKWLTAGHLNRQMVRRGENGHVKRGAHFDPEPFTGGLARRWFTKDARASAEPEARGTKPRSGCWRMCATCRRGAGGPGHPHPMLQRGRVDSQIGGHIAKRTLALNDRPRRLFLKLRRQRSHYHDEPRFLTAVIAASASVHYVWGRSRPAEPDLAISDTAPSASSSSISLMNRGWIEARTC